jgi:hypothetical protein
LQIIDVVNAGSKSKKLVGEEFGIAPTTLAQFGRTGTKF